MVKCIYLCKYTNVQIQELCICYKDIKIHGYRIPITWK